jgi:hypothetical protein
MKIRNGFVSNSSSSSFIMLIPKSFDVDKFDFTPHSKTLDHNDSDEETVKKSFKQLQSDGYLDDYNSSNYYVITKIFNNFVIASIETGPDSGGISLLSEKEIDKIKKLLL